ncbi:MAG: hypothetical protein RXR39_04115 [Caldivirga sp.]
MEDLRRCVLLDMVRMLNGSCSIDKLALLMYMVDKLSGYFIFNWSIEDYMPISQDFLDTIENLRRGGYLDVNNGRVTITTLPFDVSTCGNNWLYSRLISYVSEVVSKYRDKDVHELLGEITDIVI